MKKYALLVLALMVLAVPVLAGTATNTGLESLYNEVSSWLTGAPGKIMGIAFIILGIWMARQGSFLWFFAGLLMAIVLTVIPNIVATRFTACF